MRRNTLYKHLNINNFSTYYYTLWQPWPLHFTEPTKLNYNSAPLQNLQVWDKASDRQSGWVGANPSRYGWVTLPQATCLAGLSDGTVGAPPFFFRSLNYARLDVTCNWDEIIPKIYETMSCGGDLLSTLLNFDGEICYFLFPSWQVSYPSKLKGAMLGGQCRWLA